MLEWDENKRQSNLDKHGFDFIDAETILFGKCVLVPSRYAGAEERFLAIGELEGRMVAAVFTLRDQNYRIISMRRARHAERRTYRELLGRSAA